MVDGTAAERAEWFAELMARLDPIRDRITVWETILNPDNPDRGVGVVLTLTNGVVLELELVNNNAIYSGRSSPDNAPMTLDSAYDLILAQSS